MSYSREMWHVRQNRLWRGEVFFSDWHLWQLLNFGKRHLLTRLWSKWHTSTGTWDQCSCVALANIVVAVVLAVWAVGLVFVKHNTFHLNATENRLLIRTDCLFTYACCTGSVQTYKVTVRILEKNRMSNPLQPLVTRAVLTVLSVGIVQGGVVILPLWKHKHKIK